MSKNEFDELLLKKLREADFEYNPASWEKLSQLLPTGIPMTETSFDELLVKKLETEQLEYKTAGWEQLAAKLPPAMAPVADMNRLVPGNRKKWGLAVGIAAAIAIVLGSAIVLKQMDSNETVDTTQPTIAKQIPKANNNTTTVPQSTNQVITPQTNQSNANPKVTGTQNTNNIAGQQHQPAANNTQNNFFNNSNTNNSTNPFNQNIAPQPEQIAQHEPVPQPQIVQEPVEEKTNVVIPSVRENRTPATYAYNNENSGFYEGNGNTRKDAKTSISLGGGVNYGNLNTGYTAGVTVRRKVAGDFFVDGTVAMMYNNNANNVAINNGPSLADNNLAARPAAFNETPLSSPALDPIQKLYYVQFNPSIGYQIEKHVALSIGGDFQQMLNKKEEIVQPESNNSKLFPNFDVGLTTKSEFSSTPNIQAGLMYREGLNNLIKNEGSKYVNRRYVQVQFKYNIPVN